MLAGLIPAGEHQQEEFFTVPDDDKSLQRDSRYQEFAGNKYHDDQRYQYLDQDYMKRWRQQRMHERIKFRIAEIGRHQGHTQVRRLQEYV